MCSTLLTLVVPRIYSARGTPNQHTLLLIYHSALNIALFPPLLFFSALYYTDVPSTLSVLIFYWFFLSSHKRNTSPWLRAPVLIILGAVSLLFRQTNIFWVAIFPMSIVLVNELDRGHHVVKDSMYRRAEGFGDSTMSILKTSWKMETVFDLSVRDAWLEGTFSLTYKHQKVTKMTADYFKTVVSIVICTLKVAKQPNRIRSLAIALAPYMALILLFAGFVIWNGGVVLGDKSNHIATLHLPQILYIWPCFTFFSWPLLYPYLAALPMALLAKMPNVATLDVMLMFKRRHLAPRLWLLGLFVAVSCIVVHFNTIIHPFTLADNRHYTFYVFRLLMRPSWMKYGVTPIYIICGWACIQALSARPLTEPRSTPNKSAEARETSPNRTRPLSLPDGTNSARTSFVLIWLATTSLQLITAPLVEPRYFILPWIFWRMHVPLQQYTPAPSNSSPVAKAAVAQDHRLWLETAWCLCINAVTGYIFLTWEFSWPQEPGKVQRFMW